MENEMIIKRFSTLSTTAVSDATGGHTNVNAAIKPLLENFKIAGRALTVRLPDGENGAVLEAISKAKKGDVLVIDAKGNTNRAVAGDFVIQLAKGIGIQGMVVDGVVRDLAAIRELKFPVFALGTTVAAGNKYGGGEVDVPVALGKVAVHTGDIVVGDIDGVVIIREEELETVLQAAELKMEKDIAREVEALQNGEQSIRAYLNKVLQK